MNAPQPEFQFPGAWTPQQRVIAWGVLIIAVSAVIRHYFGVSF